MSKWKISTIALSTVVAVALIVGLVAFLPGAGNGSLSASKAITPSATETTSAFTSDWYNYERVDLAYDQIKVVAVQMNPKPVDAKTSKSIRQGVERNLEHMLYLCDAALAWGGGGAKLLVFPEFTLTGFDNTWTREEWLDIAIWIDGDEVEAISEKAAQLGCYIAFGSHTQDKAWPGHFVNNALIVSPENGGELIYQGWKAYSGMGPGLEYSTTVMDVLDEYIDMYGVEAVWPVARTPIGNLAAYICSSGFAPETARAFAMNGAEILIRIYGSGGPTLSSGKHMTLFKADCAASRVWGVMSTGGDGWTINRVPLAEDLMGGGSMIVDPDGNIRNKAADTREQVVAYTIPIETFRAHHRPPAIRTEIYALALTEHLSKYPPNLLTQFEDEYGRLPVDGPETIAYYNENSRW